MAKTREITFADENWKKIDELLESIPDSWRFVSQAITVGNSTRRSFD